MSTQSHLSSSPLETNYRKLFKTSILKGIPYIFLILALLTVSWSFRRVGGIDDFSSAFLYDLPYLCLVFAALLYTMRPGLWRVAVAVTPFMLLYVSTDLYYIYLQSIFKLDDIFLLSEGLNVCPAWIKTGIFSIVFVWGIAFIFFLKRHPRQFVVPLLLFTLAAVPPIAAYKIPKQFLNVTETLGVSVLPWSDRWTAALMGRTVSLLLFAAEKKKALAELVLQPIIDDPDRDPVLLKKSLHEKRNIHILVLESFLDPQLFSKLKYRTPVDPPQFETVRKKMHVAESPVFGGGTAQAEFEVLCGVPAYKRYTSAEFNMFDGSSTPCLPNLLAGAGYRTVATQSYKPDFFNSEKAYRSLGFEETNFPTVFAGSRPTYLKYDIPYAYIFDGDLLSQNLSYVQKLLSEGHPFLNYVLGVYGHMPHETDTERFPPKIDIVGLEKRSQAYLAIQQFHYRAGAVADYLKKLREMDPKGIILITSDHLPPLDLGPKTYQTLGYKLDQVVEEEYRQNIWIYDGPQSKNTFWPNHYFEYMDFLLDTLTEGRFCKEVVCKNHQAWTPEKLTVSYDNLMVQGAGVLKKPADLVAGPLPRSTTTDLGEPAQQQIR